jgi:putative transcriptional regulator
VSKAQRRDWPHSSITAPAHRVVRRHTCESAGGRRVLRKKALEYPPFAGVARMRALSTDAGNHKTAMGIQGQPCAIYFQPSRNYQSIADVARETGLHRHTITLLYDETAMRVDLEAVEKLCALFDVPVGELFFEHIPTSK